jgi:hypothetical protein
MFKYHSYLGGLELQLSGDLKEIIPIIHMIFATKKCSPYPIYIIAPYDGAIECQDSKSKWAYVLPTNIPVDYMKKKIGVFNAKIGERILIEIGYGCDSDDFYGYINKIGGSIDSYSKLPKSISWFSPIQYVSSIISLSVTSNKIKMSDLLKQELQKHKIDMSFVSWIIKCKYDSCHNKNCKYYHNKDMIPFILVVETKDNKYCKYGKRCTNIQCVFDHSDTWKFDCKYKTLIVELCNLYKTFSEDHIKVGKFDFEYV